VSEGNAKYHFTATNLSPVHEVSEGNAGESLCALGFIYMKDAQHMPNQETKKQPKSKQGHHFRSKRSKEDGNKLTEAKQVEIRRKEDTT